MCNVFSGLIVTAKGKDWGKVIFETGVHHEKDRLKHQKKYGDELLAWESQKEYSLKDGFIFTHILNIPEKEQKELMKLVEKWAKKQNKETLLRQMITVCENNKPTENYQIIENMIKTGDNTAITVDFTTHTTQGDDSTATQGYNSTATQGYNSTATQGDYSTATQRYGSTATQGDYSTATQGSSSTATQGYDSTATQGDRSTATQGDYSVQIVYGEIGYIVLKGKNNVFIQHWMEKGKNKKAIIDIDKLHKKHKIGAKIKIHKGKPEVLL